MNNAHDIPGLKPILEKCQQDIEKLLDQKVTVYYSLKVHHLPSSKLVDIISEVTEVPWSVVLKGGRKGPIVIARQLYCYYAFTVQRKTLADIARVIGRDHTSVIAARDRIAEMIATNDELYMPYVNSVESQINHVMLLNDTEIIKQ